MRERFLIRSLLILLSLRRHLRAIQLSKFSLLRQVQEEKSQELKSLLFLMNFFKNSSADFCRKLKDAKWRVFVCSSLFERLFTKAKYLMSLILSWLSSDFRMQRVLRNYWEQPLRRRSFQQSFQVAIFYSSFSRVLVRRDLILNLPSEAAFCSFPMLVAIVRCLRGDINSVIQQNYNNSSPSLIFKLFCPTYILYPLQKNMRKHHRGAPEFTHFTSIPFIRQAQRQKMSILQKQIAQQLQAKDLAKYLQPNNPNLFHLTLSMLTLAQSKMRERTKEILHEKKDDFIKILHNTKLTTDNLGYFTRPVDYKNKFGPKFVNVIYLDLKQDENYQRIKQALDYLIKVLMKEDIIASEELKSMNIEYDHKTGMFQTKKLHITLFRCKGLYENEEFLEQFGKVEEILKGEELECDWIDISTRFVYDETKFYQPLYRIPIREEIK